MPLEMKYFVLKPGGKNPKDPHVLASRQALLAYAEAIGGHDYILAFELREWVKTLEGSDATSEA